MDSYHLLTLLAVGLTPLVMGWFPCGNCGSCVVNCSTCDGGRAPQRLQMEVAGLQNFLCLTCDDYNSTYILNWGNATAPSSCRWFVVEDISSCGNALLAEVLLPRLGSSNLIALLHSGNTDPFTGGVGSWRKLLSAGELECTAWDDIPLTYDGSPDECDASAATCHITAL